MGNQVASNTKQPGANGPDSLSRSEETARRIAQTPESSQAARAVGEGFWTNSGPTPQSVLALQQTAGNQAVTQFLESSLNQAHSDDGRTDDFEAAAIVDPGLTDSEELRTKPETAPPANQGPGRSEEQTAPAPDSFERKEEAHLSRVANAGSSMLGAWSGFSASAGRASGWGSQAGIGPPQPISWGAMPAANGSGTMGQFQAIGPPSAKGVVQVQALSGNPLGIGATQAPTNFTAPNFDFNSVNKAAAGAAATWYSSPTSTARAFEGDSTSYYVFAGLSKTNAKEAGLDVYWNFPADISTLDQAAEQEHCDDIMHAYNISLKEADDVLMAHVIGKDFGPKPTKAEAEQLVLDAITGHLTHPGLGADKTTWGTTYDTLFTKTVTRDNSNWHTFGKGNRRTFTSRAGVTDVYYDINKGTTKINKVLSPTIIKY